MKDKMMKVLLIEDSDDERLLLTELMSRAPWPEIKFNFVCAESLARGLDALAKERFDAVLLDLMLPDSSGIETVVRVHAQFPALPIVVLTGMLDESLGLKAVMRGAQDYQVKGTIKGHALGRSLAYAVERQRLRGSLQAIIQGAPDAMFILASQGVVRYVNPAAESLLDLNAGELLNRPFPRQMFSSRSGAMTVTVAGGIERVVDMRVSEIAWEDEPASLVTIRDMTDLRRMEQLKAEVLERVKMDKLKDDLMSAVSHDLRNPLTIVKAAAKNIQDGLAGPLSGEQEHMVSLQYKNILRIERIVDRILDLSRLESGRAQINTQRVKAEKLIRETVNGFRLLAVEKNIPIEQEIDPGLPDVFADPELVLQVLGNLIDNALRYAQKRILIRAFPVAQAPKSSEKPRGPGQEPPPPAPPGPFVQISVIDDGRGVPRERLGELFNKFVQVDRQTNGGGYKGTGLGLAICREIVEHQQGRIWIESGQGPGARFHFILPQCEAEFGGEKGGAYAWE